MTEFGIFFRLVLPLCKPAIAAMAVLNGIASWNNFLWPLLALRSRPAASDLRWVADAAVLVDPTEPDATVLAAQLRRQPEVEFAEPNYLYRTRVMPNDPGFVDRFVGDAEPEEGAGVIPRDGDNRLLRDQELAGSFCILEFRSVGQAGRRFHVEKVSAAGQLGVKAALLECGD